MSRPVEILLVLLMYAGLVGTVLPLLPGLPLIWGAALFGVLAGDLGPRGTIALVVLTALLIAGTAAKYVLPARSGQPLPRTSLLAAAIGGLVGFVVIPVIGLPIGAALGLYLAEAARTDPVLARTSTVTALKRYGVGALLEIAAGIAMIVTWSLLT